MRFGVTVNIFIAASFLFLSGFAGNDIASAVEEEDGKTGKSLNKKLRAGAGAAVEAITADTNTDTAGPTPAPAHSSNTTHNATYHEEEISLNDNDDAWRFTSKNEDTALASFDGEEEDVSIDIDSTTAGTCNVRYHHWLGDGYCDKYGGYNTIECGYDHGDCCQSTCRNGDYTCGYSGYDCKHDDDGNMRYLIYLYCARDGVSHEGTYDRIRWSWKTYGSNKWYGTQWFKQPKGICEGRFGNFGSQVASLPVLAKAPIESFRIEAHGTDAMFLDWVALEKKVGPRQFEERVRQYGADEGNGYCLSRDANDRFSSYCANNRSYYCFEFRSNGQVYLCEGARCNFPLYGTGGHVHDTSHPMNGQNGLNIYHCDE